VQIGSLFVLDGKKRSRSFDENCVLMPVSTGDKIGCYEVEGLLGAGDMGELYRARDIQLGRSVALKVLPLALATDAQYMARFEREAQIVAALNHPNIAAI
jgi:serine/threonine protein kinase